MRYHCCDPRRREAVLATGPASPPNGIDFLEVLDAEAPTEADRQRLLRVRFLKEPLPPLDALTPRDVHVDGGVRVTGIRVEELSWSADVLTVRVDRPGDFSEYTLRIGDPGVPPGGLDARLASVGFAFKVECPTDFDCADDHVCPPADDGDVPEIDYLARDYAGFRRLVLDRLAVLAPQWQERNPADLGVTLVEVLAYVADRLSYRIDAVAAESTLLTARRRDSARRHARLVDYAVSDGSNARAWVQVGVDAAGVALPAGTQLLSRVPGLPDRIVPSSPEERLALAAAPVVFETMHDAVLQADLAAVCFHTWGDRECCLPAGAVSATLRGHPPLAAGDVLVLAERVGAGTGSEADADPVRRHAVRLLDVAPTVDPLGTWFDDPTAPPAPLDVTEVTWHAEDALPFPLCLSAEIEGTFVADVAVALGNIVLADHGRTLGEDLPPVPAPDPRLAPAARGGSHCEPAEATPVPARYAPVLGLAPVTMAGTLGRSLPGGDQPRWARFDPGRAASAVFAWEERHVLPEVVLTEGGAREWHPRRDLLASGRFAPEFVAEPEPDGRTRLRFGDDEYGLRPATGTRLRAAYRVGSGPAGNVGIDALRHVVTADPRVSGASNPLPARGGRAAESIEHVRQWAPYAFRDLQRAVTPQDYADLAGRHPAVQRAVATERWTGSWYTVFLTVDRHGGAPVDAGFEADLRDHLERYRLAGHDLEVDGPRYVALEIELRVCVLPDYYRADVDREVRDVLGSRDLPDGRRGLFHPDAWTFADTVHLSRLTAAAQAVPGVRHVEALTFRRLGEPASSALGDGALVTGRIEVPRLDGDPNQPENGVLRLVTEGGR